MTDLHSLIRAETEFRPLLLNSDARAIGSAVMGWNQSGLTARIVRGRKMRARNDLFDEFSAALQFPLYFGENWDAFDECIAELEMLVPGEGYVLAITEPDQVLLDADTDELRNLVEALASAVATWGQPVELGESWDRPAVPFHVVLAGEPEQVEDAVRRWSSAGVAPSLFTGPSVG